MNQEILALAEDVRQSLNDMTDLDALLARTRKLVNAIAKYDTALAEGTEQS